MRWTILFSMLLMGTAAGHPISQGALEIAIFPDKVSLQGRMSSEEILLAMLLRDDAPEAGLTSADTWRRHGEYLLKHFHLATDHGALTGRLVNVEAESSSKGTPVRFAFEFRPISTGVSRPAELNVRQDVLKEIEFAPGVSWEATYVVRIGIAGQAPQEGLLLTSKHPLHFKCDWESANTGAAPVLDKGRMTREYLHHGVMHILSGYDHLLFITALVLAAVSFWDLVKVVTAFTAAHSLTLTFSVLDWLRLPERVVEPMIAASIVFVALQNVFWPERSRGWGRLAIAFFFGLFHGLGFAGGLLEAMSGMAGVAVMVSILAFSLGVELGHQVVVLPLFFGLKLARRFARNGQAKIPQLALRYGSALISVAGIYYLIAALR